MSLGTLQKMAQTNEAFYHVGSMGEVLGSQLCTCPALAFMAMWGVNQQMEVFSLSLTLHFK